MDVIIRFSLDGDRSSKLRNKLKDVLKSGNIDWDSSTTATYRGSNISSVDLAKTLANFWTAVNADKRRVSFDHFWMYCDNPPPLAGFPKDLIDTDENFEVTE